MFLPRQGLEWVAKNHIKPAVVHMSIEGGFSSIVNQAVEQLIKINHVHVVVSSGRQESCAGPLLNLDGHLAMIHQPAAFTLAALGDP